VYKSFAVISMHVCDDDGSGEPSVDAEAYKDGRSARQGCSAAGHAEERLALADDCFLRPELRMARHVGEGTEADKGCASCQGMSVGRASTLRERQLRTDYTAGGAVLELGAVLPGGGCCCGCCRWCWARHGSGCGGV
jgi:hypothetical protein